MFTLVKRKSLKSKFLLQEIGKEPKGKKRKEIIKIIEIVELEIKQTKSTKTEKINERKLCFKKKTQ